MLVAILALAMLAAACGSDGSESSSTTEAEGATTTAGDTDTTDDPDAPATTTGEEALPVSGECDATRTLTWGFDYSIGTWDPHSSPAGNDQQYQMLVYDALFRMDPSNTVEGNLADSWEFNDDATLLTIALKDGVVFHDGTPLTAEIVKTNLDRARGETDVEGAFVSSFTADLAAIDSVTAVDDATIEIAMAEANVGMASVLTDRPGMVMHPDTFVTDATTQITEPIGTGPYTLDSWSQGEGGEAVLGAFADYHSADDINLAGIVFKDLADPAARFNGLSSGDIDGAPIEPADFEAADSNDSLSVATGDTVEVWWYMLNRDADPALDDVRVRQAISLAIDREGIVEGLNFGLGTPAVTLFPPTLWAANPDIEVPARDVEAAKALMAEAGVESLDIGVFQAGTTGLRADNTAAVQANLAEIGINLTIEVAGADVATRLFVNKEGGGIVGAWSGRADPSQVVANAYLETGFVNIAKKGNAEMSALLVEANAATDQDERASLFQEIDALYAEDFTSGIPIYSPKQVLAFNSELSGIEVYTSGRPDLRNACFAG